MDKALVSGAKDCGFESRRGYIFRSRVSAIGVVVSIVASQAIDPGSIPGWRMRRNFYYIFGFSFLTRDR